MSTTLTLAERRVTVFSRACEFVELTKPRIAVLLLVVVAASATVATWGQPNPWLVLHAMIGTLLVAAAASTGNQIIERNRDRFMKRTAGRPLPSGRIATWEAIAFAACLLTTGSLWLVMTVGWLSAAWAVLTWFMYVLVYTPLKVRSSANTAVGAVAGALPVFIGWSAMGQPIDLRGVALFLLLFLWQFPHFMAIAWIYREQYGRAGMKMLTVVDPTGRRAGVQAIITAAALVPVALIPALDSPDLGAAAYIVIASLLGIGQLLLSVAFCLRRDEESARLLLKASLIYLPAVLFLLTIFPWF